MNLTFKHKLLAAGICLLPVTGFAADASEALNYGWLEADYINFDIDQPNEDSIFSEDFDNGGGFGVSASLPLSEMFFLFGDYSETESDFTFVDNLNIVQPAGTDLQRLNLGAGVRLPMSDRADLVLSGAYTDLDYDHFGVVGSAGNNSFDDLNEDASDGFILDARFRMQLTQALEGSIGARYTEIEDADGLSLVGNVLFELSPNWGINLSLDAGDELMTYGAGVRYSF
ncbi:MAG: hypothetical protein RLZZ227_1974 [Pseudomonadota bacterium]